MISGFPKMPSVSVPAAAWKKAKLDGEFEKLEDENDQALFAQLFD